jgi:flagellar protein FliO/FliZ
MIIKSMVILQKSDLINQLNSGVPEETNQGISTSDSIWQLMGLVLLLIVILAAAYFTSKFVGGIKLGQMKNSNFKIIDSYRISPNKALQIIKIGNKFVVISICKDTINYITELDESEVQVRDIGEKQNQSFKQILEKLKINKE